MKICTIGFTKKSAAEFFGLLKDHGIQRVIDIRLRNKSQLSGFAKGRDLEFFLKEICKAEYIHEPLLVPSEDLFRARKLGLDWRVYEGAYLRELATRSVLEMIPGDLFRDPTVLLCSEASPAECHRRLVAEYLQEHWEEVIITHL